MLFPLAVCVAIFRFRATLGLMEKLATVEKVWKCKGVINCLRSVSDPGLDPSHFRSQQQYQREEEADSMLGVSLQLTDEERYKDCEQFTFACPECGTDNVYDGVFEGTVSGTRGPRKKSSHDHATTFCTRRQMVKKK